MTDYLLRARSLDRHKANSKTVLSQKLKICPTTYFRLYISIRQLNCYAPHRHDRR
ncbi:MULTISPECIES: hypothetical protein [unclassified Microcoleus]|uniref:hypothetical protein n=1 Tax=unclassified Microcoleus TaxID=2642155 RepID=UPI002FCF130A